MANPQPEAYLGFDRNDYPGDAAMRELRKTFRFTSYWLSPPPGEKSNRWSGKRELLKSLGFGFAVLYSGPESRRLKNGRAAATRGVKDADEAAAAARQDGFPGGTVIFLDIEEGGRLPAAYHAYLRAWARELSAKGFRAGVYCSGMPVREDAKHSITTAEDIRTQRDAAAMSFWVYNDACPPSPGCAFPKNPPAVAASGISYATIWQYAQSPRRKEFTGRCAASYHPDGNCYAPSDTESAWYLDVNAATSADPSGGLG